MKLSIALSPVTNNYPLSITKRYTLKVNAWSHVTSYMHIKEGGAF